MATETVRIEGVAGVMRTLEQLPAELVSKRGGPVRTALQKAAKQIQLAELTNLQSIIDAPNRDPELAESTGLLKKNIVVKRGRLSGGEKGELYSVSVRRVAYSTGKGKAVTTPQVARLLEYGTATRPPLPFIRPAFEQNKVAAVRFFFEELNRRLDGIVKKLARRNGVA